MDTTNPLVMAPHAHDQRCWWDHRSATWTCPADTPADPPAVDVRDMVVVHTAMLREFRLAPAAVRRTAPGDTAQAAVVEAHLALLCDLLHHHHAGEDDLLWPPLRSRLPASTVARLDRAEEQHAGIDRSLQEVAAARAAWVGEADAACGEQLATALERLHVLLAEHLDTEERTLLPLAAVHLTPAEWQAVGAAGAASVPKKQLPLVFGMFAYEGDPEVLADMLRSAPAVPRFLVPRIAPRIYARHARRVHGTARP